MSNSLKLFLLLVLAALLFGCESTARADQPVIIDRVVFAKMETIEPHTQKIHTQQRDMVDRLKKIHIHLENKEKLWVVEPIMVRSN